MPSGAIGDTPEARAYLRGSLLRNFLDAGAPITMNDVLRPRDRGFAAAVLKEGARAVAISVDAVSGAAGLIWPGDHVDVLLTQDAQTKGGSEKESLVATQGPSSQTLPTDARVIAIDQNLAQGAADSAGKLVRTSLPVRSSDRDPDAGCAAPGIPVWRAARRSRRSSDCDNRSQHTAIAAGWCHTSE
jgi:pilus assembly protein CpaB